MRKLGAEAVGSPPCNLDKKASASSSLEVKNWMVPKNWGTQNQKHQQFPNFAMAFPGFPLLGSSPSLVAICCSSCALVDWAKAAALPPLWARSASGDLSGNGDFSTWCGDTKGKYGKKWWEYGGVPEWRHVFRILSRLHLDGIGKGMIAHK